MTDQFLAEIRIFPYNFAPYGWAECDGQIMQIGQNTALFSLIGTFYGGDGVTTFGLPNLQGSVPVAWGQGAGLSNYSLGQTGGSPTVTLETVQLPAHTHTLQAQTGRGVASDTPSTGNALAPSAGGAAYAGPTNLVGLSESELSPAGGGQPHNNLMPFLTLTFCIALVGIFPSRN